MFRFVLLCVVSMFQLAVAQNVNMNISIIFSTRDGQNHAALWKLFSDPDDYATKLDNVTANDPSIPLRMLSFNFGQPAGTYDDLAVDYVNSYLYHADNAKKGLHKGAFVKNTNYTAVDYFHSQSMLTKLTGVAYDWVTNNLYWTDGTSIRATWALYVAKTYFSPGLISNSSLSAVVDIQIDPINRYLFWADAAVPNTIVRADLLANDRVNITVGCSPTKLQVDVTGQKVYFLDPVNGTFGSVAYDGSDLQTWATIFDDYSTFAIYKNYVIFGEKTAAAIRFFNKETQEMISSYTVDGTEGGQYSVTDVVVFAATNQPSGTNSCTVRAGGCSAMCFANSSTTNVCLCPDGYKTVTDGKNCCSEVDDFCTRDGSCLVQAQKCNHFYTCDDESDEYNCPYYSSVDRNIAILTSYTLPQYRLACLEVLVGNPIDYVTKLDNRTTSYNGSLPFTAFRYLSGGGKGHIFDSISVDSRESMAYYANNELKQLAYGPHMAHANFYNVPQPVVSSVSMPAPINSIALDWLSKNLYWTDGRSISITKFNKASSYTKKIIADVGPENVADIVVDPTKRYAFWCSNGTSQTIYRSDLAGNNRVSLAVNGLPSKLSLDAPTGRIYYMDRTRKFISFISYDGTGEPTATGAINDYATAFTVTEDFIVVGSNVTSPYVTVLDKTSFTRFNIFRSMINLSISGTVTDMATDSRNSQPIEPSNPCAVNNGGCSQICIANSSSESVCQCADDTTDTTCNQPISTK